MRHLTRKTKEALYYALQRLADKGIVKPNIYLSDEDMSEILVEMGPMSQEEYETFWQDAKRYLQDCVAEGKFDETLRVSYRNPRYRRRNPSNIAYPRLGPRTRGTYRIPARRTPRISQSPHRRHSYPTSSSRFDTQIHTERLLRPRRNPMPAFLSAGIISDAIKEIRVEKGGHRFRILSPRAWGRVVKRLSKKYNMEEKAVEQLLHTTPGVMAGRRP